MAENLADYYGRLAEYKSQSFWGLFIIHAIIRLFYRGPFAESFMAGMAARHGAIIRKVVLNLFFTWLLGFWGGLVHYLWTLLEFYIVEVDSVYAWWTYTLAVFPRMR